MANNPTQAPHAPQAPPPPPPPPPPQDEPTKKFFKFNVEDLNQLRKRGKEQRHAIKDAKEITNDLIKVAKNVIQQAIDISKPGVDNAALLIRALRTDFRKDVFNILKAAGDTLMENFEEKFSNKWVSELTNHMDANENIYKNVMMERVGGLAKKLMGLMDPIQALNYTDDQKVELAIDASIAIPTGLFIASITMYSKSLPLVMRLNGLIPPTIIANFETTLTTIICIFNNLKKFERITKVEGNEKDDKRETMSSTETKNNKETTPTWESYGIEDGVGEHEENQKIPYDKKITASAAQKLREEAAAKKEGGEAATEEMFWQCDAEGLRLADQNEREIKEQYRLIKEGIAREERAKKRKAEAAKMKAKIETDNKALEEADKKGELTGRAKGREKTKKKYSQKPPPAAAASSNNSASALNTMRNVGNLRKML